MTPEQMRDRAEELFDRHMHCSQVVLAAGLEKMGLEEPELIRAMAALGGGIASTGRACGCLTGGVAALSRLFGKSRPEERDDPAMWRLAFKLSKRFEELTGEHGGVDCRLISRMNWSDKEATREFYQNRDSRLYTVCKPLVGQTAQVLGELLEEHQQKGA